MSILKHRVHIETETPSPRQTDTLDFAAQRNAHWLAQQLVEKLKEDMKVHKIQSQIFHSDEHDTTVYSNTLYVFTKDELLEVIDRFIREGEYLKVCRSVVRDS